jgi:hypothetical protein
MRAPMPPGAAIDSRRLDSWATRFRFYRASPDKTDIQNWLARFKTADHDLAARLLDCVEVISEATIQQGYKQALGKIAGWHPNEGERDGQWLFTGFGGPGESGLAMLRVFREANSLAAKKYDKLFGNIVDIPSRRLSAEDTVVLVDDFAGTGRQICGRWPTLSELIACDARCYLVLTGATVDAIGKIQEETTLEVLVQSKIQKNENIFSHRCTKFSGTDKAALLPYCSRADKQNPRGFGDCGLLYVLSHKTPNNSIPVLHANHARWLGLFPRYLQPEK